MDVLPEPLRFTFYLFSYPRKLSTTDCSSEHFLLWLPFECVQ
jgi:hypothetical protein